MNRPANPLHVKCPFCDAALGKPCVVHFRSSNILKLHERKGWEPRADQLNRTWPAAKTHAARVKAAVAAARAG